MNSNFTLQTFAPIDVSVPENPPQINQDVSTGLIPKRTIQTNKPVEAYQPKQTTEDLHAKGSLPGYAMKKVAVRTVAGRLHLHQMTKLDYKQKGYKERLFNQLIPYLMSELGIPQTKALESLISAIQFTPYLRKVNRGTMLTATDDPSRVQSALLVELVNRMKQGFSLFELCKVAANCQSVYRVSDTDKSKEAFCIGQTPFTSEELGDETFREIRDCLVDCEKNNHPRLTTILENIRQKKEISMAHWRNIYLKIIAVQDSTVRQQMTSALNRDEEKNLFPATATECQIITRLIPTSLRFTTHPGFTVMKPLFFWLSENHLKGKKLSSQRLAWLRSMAMNKLYTQLPAIEKTGLEKLCIYKEPLIDSENTSVPLCQSMRATINDTSPQECSNAAELFAKLYCDLTPSVNAENRLAIIYTLLKFRDQRLLRKLLVTQNMGRDALLAIYKTQLILTYSLENKADDTVKAEKEKAANCLLKTLLVRMALCTTLMAQKEGVSISPEVMSKAQALIDHHNEGLRTVLSKAELKRQSVNYDSYDDVDAYDDMDEYDDVDEWFLFAHYDRPPQNNKISEDAYLTIPAYLIANSRTVPLDPRQLLLPMDRYFRLESPGKLADNRRECRTQRDETKLLDDFLLVPQTADLTQPLDWSSMDVPISYLFPGKNTICTRERPLIKELTQISLQTIREKCPEEQVTLAVIRQLFALAGKAGKPGVRLQESIESIASDPSGRPLSPLLFNLAEALPGLPANRDRRQLLEYVACQLFAELNPAERQFKRLVKILYVIQSRSNNLRFYYDEYGSHRYGNNETSKLKLELGKLVRHEWNQPDAMLGNRIRQAMKAAFKNYHGGGYQQIMISVLDTMRPENQASDTYPSLMYRISHQTEKLLEKRRTSENMKSQDKILYCQKKQVCKENLADQVKALIQSTSQLCDQIFAGTWTDNSALTSMVVSPSNQPLPELTAADDAHGYLHDQLQALAASIGQWLNATIDDELIPEVDAVSSGVDKLIQFVGNLAIREKQETCRQNSQSIVKQIVDLRNQFAKLQLKHAQWEMFKQFVTTHNQWQEATSNLKQLRRLHPLPTPSTLQEQIERFVTPARSDLSPADQAVLNTVSPLMAKDHDPVMLTKALHLHYRYARYNQDPRLFTDRIAQLMESWDAPTRSLHDRYKPLSATCSYLGRHPLITAFNNEQKKALKKVREFHKHSMNSLQTKQKECESHWLNKLSYQSDGPLLRILEQMKGTHDIQHSGINKGSLSPHQKEQLLALVEYNPIPNNPLSTVSLFDMIGMESAKTDKEKSPPCDQQWAMSSEDWFNYYDGRQTFQITQLKENLAFSHKTLNEITAAHGEKEVELAKYNTILDSLLGTRKNTQIQIGNQWYSYTNAIIAFANKNNVFRLRSNLSDAQRRTTFRLTVLAIGRRRAETQHQDVQKWLTLAKECSSMGINPESLPAINKLTELGGLATLNDIENTVADLEQRIADLQKKKDENSARIATSVGQLTASLQKELEAQRQQTRAAEQELFARAFEQGQQLSETRAIQHVLCRYLRQDSAISDIRARVLEDCEAQEKHIPVNYREIIEPPWHGGPQLLPLPFAILNVKGAFPLLESLHKQGRLHPFQLLMTDAQGQQSSALIFAAATGRYNACEALLNILANHRRCNIDDLNQLLTSSPVSDKRHLLHHIAGLARPGTMDALLQLIDSVSKKQEYDADYSVDCLQNRVAMDKEYLLKELLSQEDVENHLPTDLLLFNIGEKISKWPGENEQAITSFCNDLLINNAKLMWRTAAESLKLEQLHKAIECFMKGIDDLSQLSPAKREAAESFLKGLMRIFTVHGSQELYDGLMDRIKS